MLLAYLFLLRELPKTLSQTVNSIHERHAMENKVERFGDKKLALPFWKVENQIKYSKRCRWSKLTYVINQNDTCGPTSPLLGGTLASQRHPSPASSSPERHAAGVRRHDEGSDGLFHFLQTLLPARGKLGGHSAVGGILTGSRDGFCGRGGRFWVMDGRIWRSPRWRISGLRQRLRPPRCCATRGGGGFFGAVWGLFARRRSQPPWWGATWPGPAQSTTSEAVHGATRVGSGFLGGGCVARDTVVISLGGHGVSPKACWLRLWWWSVEVGGGSRDGAELRVCGRPWWTPTTGGRYS
jgi:hypothetical protein